MANPATKGLSRESLRMIVAAAVVVLLVLALPIALMLRGDADTSSDVPTVSASADENGEAYINLIAHNLEYGDYLHVMYALDVNLPEGMDERDIKMIFWNAPQTSTLRRVKT